MGDRRVKRYWTIGLDQAGKAPPCLPKPAKAERQQVVFFDGREGSQERFSFWLTFPHADDNTETPPSQKQYDAVKDFYGAGPSTRDQAGYLLSAWYYAEEIKSVQRFRFTAPRRKLIQVGVSAYILAHPDIREKVNAWTQVRWRQPTDFISIEKTRAYPATMQFACDMIADLQSAGAEVFG